MNKDIQLTAFHKSLSAYISVCIQVAVLIAVLFGVSDKHMHLMCVWLLGEKIRFLSHMEPESM